jgi:hypothetical protein
MADGRTVPVVILGPNTTPGQPIMINPGMVMPQQQPGLCILFAQEKLSKCCC